MVIARLCVSIFVILVVWCLRQRDARLMIDTQTDMSRCV